MILQRSVAAAAVVVVVLVTVVVVRAEGGHSAGDSPPRYYDSADSKDLDERSQKANYNFNYAVKDDHFSNDFGHQKSRDGENTQGSYYVRLPDGRLQKVTYYVDGDSGFVAEVSYEGEARQQLKNLKESHDSTKTSYYNSESKESKESYAPARILYRSPESEESRASYSHSSVSFQSLHSEESEEVAVHAAPTKRVRTGHKPTHAYPRPTPTSANLQQRPVVAKPSGRRPHHSSEESQTYSPSKSSRVSDHSLRPKRIDSEEKESEEILHSSRSSTSSSEKRRKVKNSRETSLTDPLPVPKDSYETPIYIPNYTRSDSNSYKPENLLPEDFA